MILATQSIKELQESGMLQIVSRAARPDIPGQPGDPGLQRVGGPDLHGPGIRELVRHRHLPRRDTGVRRGVGRAGRPALRGP